MRRRNGKAAKGDTTGGEKRWWCRRKSGKETTNQEGREGRKEVKKEGKCT